MYVYATHAGNLTNRRLHTGISIYINNTPIIWYLKRQNTFKSSSFASEFVVLQIATESNKALRYKLRTFQVPIDETLEVFCDNKLVVANSSIPLLVLSKRNHNLLPYGERCSPGGRYYQSGFVSKGSIILLIYL